MATKWCVETNFPFWTALILEMLGNVSFSFLFLCADPQRLEDGVYRMYNLHHNLERDPSKLPNYVVNRGTNVVESAHSVFHKLLPGGNNSPEHFDTVMSGSLKRRCEREVWRPVKLRPRQLPPLARD